MTDTGKAVGRTAEGLVVLRSEPRARTMGVDDPFAAWFVTEDGHALVRMAMAVDGVYAEFNLARYRYTSALLTRHAGQYEQMVFLGSGFDCRALWLDGLREGRVRIYEADTRPKIDQKLDELRRHGVVVPPWNRHVACDLRDHGINALLKDEGFDCRKPVLLLAEGLVFYLPADTTSRILDPKWLGLAKGSLVVFDCWADNRVNGLNGRVSERIGTRLFQPFPFMTGPDRLREDLCRLGYAKVRVTGLGAIAEGYYGQAFEDEFPASWWMVEATV